MHHRRVVVLVGPRQRLHGGVSTHLKTLLKGGLTKWYEFVHVEVGFWDEPATQWERLKDALVKMRALRSVLREKPGAVVHLNPSMDPKSLLRDLPFLWIAARARSPIVVQFHGQLIDEYRSPKNPLWRRAVLASLRRADLIIVLSAVQRRSLDNVFGVSSGLRVEEMPALFLDLAPYEARQPARSPSDDVCKFLFLGRISKEKGVGDLLDATAIVARTHPRLVLHVAGSGPDEEAFRRRATEGGLAEHVVWHGYVEGDAKLDLLAEVDAFVLPSWGEGLPNALVEAMAMGLPAVVTAIGAMPQVVEDGVNGFVVLPRDVAALALRMSYLMDNGAEATEMGRRNRDVAAERFGLDTQVVSFRRIYDDVASRRSRTT